MVRFTTTRFTTTVRTDDVLHGDPDEIWGAMQDPDLLADLAPAVASIAVDGQRWCWRMVGINALGVSAAPSFTEEMVFDEAAATGGRQIRFRHAPPPGKNEAAGATGTYELLESPEGAYVGIHLTVHVDLPLPSLAGPAVRRIMHQTIVAGGQRFAANLTDRLGIPSSRGMQVVDVDAAWPRARATSSPG